MRASLDTSGAFNEKAPAEGSCAILSLGGAGAHLDFRTYWPAR
jgi:hypothetical protein